MTFAKIRRCADMREVLVKEIIEILHKKCRRLMALSAVAGMTLALQAADSRPVLGVGATRDEVLAAYGWPNGQSKSGDREIFTYPQGQVVLRNGVVERMDFSPNIAWPKPRPRPPPPRASTATVAPAGDVAAVPAQSFAWLNDLEEGKTEAARHAKDLLVFFTGSDWSPPAQRFEKEVAHAPEFLRAIEENFVLVRLDFPRNTTAQPATLRQTNERWRERFAVTTYPTLLLLDAKGRELGRVNLAKARSEPTYVAQVLAAIEEARPKPAVIAEWTKEKDEASPKTSGWPPPFSMWVAGGAAVVLVLTLVLLRRRGANPEESRAKVSEGTMPTPAEIASWPQDRLRDVAAALFEMEGARVKMRPTESGAELTVYPITGEVPRALVRCQAAAAGLAGARDVRDLLGTAVAERIDEAWYVSPGGFTPDARESAAGHGVVLISGEEFLQRLKAIPPLALLRILSATNR